MLDQSKDVKLFQIWIFEADRDLSRDYWIKLKWSSGLFGAVAAAEKKLPTAISMQLFEVVISNFCGQKNFLIFFEIF